MDKPRRQFASEEKVRILREHLIDKVPISQLCEKYQIQPTVGGRKSIGSGNG